MFYLNYFSSLYLRLALEKLEPSLDDGSCLRLGPSLVLDVEVEPENLAWHFLGYGLAEQKVFLPRHGLCSFVEYGLVSITVLGYVVDYLVLDFPSVDFYCLHSLKIYPEREYFSFGYRLNLLLGQPVLLSVLPAPELLTLSCSPCLFNLSEWAHPECPPVFHLVGESVLVLGLDDLVA